MAKELVFAGSRKSHLHDICVAMKADGISAPGVRQVLLAENEKFCTPPLSYRDVTLIVRNVYDTKGE